MARMVRDGFWFRRRRLVFTCLVILALVVSTVLTAGQNENVLNPENQSGGQVDQSPLAVYVNVLPVTQPSELELRVRTQPQVRNPPQVEFQDMAGGTVGTVNLEADEQGTGWVGTIRNLELVGIGDVHVTATSDNGVAQRHELRFATRQTVKEKPNVIHSVDGRFALVILADDVPADSRFLINTLEAPEKPLPAGVKLEGGPFQVLPMQQAPAQVKANIMIFLAEHSANSGPAPRYQLWWLGPGSGAWQVLPTITGADGRFAQAPIRDLGTFVLTSDSQ